MIMHKLGRRKREASGDFETAERVHVPSGKPDV